MEGTIRYVIQHEVQRSHDIRKFPRSCCRKSAGSIAFTDSILRLAFVIHRFSSHCVCAGSRHSHPYIVLSHSWMWKLCIALLYDDVYYFLSCDTNNLHGAEGRALMIPHLRIDNAERRMVFPPFHWVKKKAKKERFRKLPSLLVVLHLIF